jgi:hypothetical protein
MTVLTDRNAFGVAWIEDAFGGVFETISMIRAAHECSTARRERRKPSAAALRTLGIDEQAFRRTFKRR